jgi:membrane-bound metal-dependent hydrolase YbcI (DUF457 family)
MFIGHFAVGFAGKRFAPRSNLAVLMVAPLFLDMLWPIFLLLGWEQARVDPGNTRFTPLDLSYYPWSHSLLMALVWATLFAFVYYGITRYRPGTAVIWLGVVSHWVLDWISHRPDMPLYPGGPRFGLGLWNSIAGTLMVEGLIFAVGIWMYAAATRARDRIGRYAFVSYVALLLILYIGDRFSAPPPSIAVVAWSGIVAVVIFTPWAWWFDRHRGLPVRPGEERLAG